MHRFAYFLPFLMGCIVILIVMPLIGGYSFLTGLLLFAGVALIFVPHYAPAAVRQNSYLIAIAAGVITAYLAPQRTSEMRFYEITAQIVPVLFLALAVELQAFRIRANLPRGETYVGAIVALFLVIAGFESLRTISSGKAEIGQFSSVAAALVAATTNLVLIAIVGLPGSQREHSPIRPPVAPTTKPPSAKDLLALLLVLLIRTRRRQSRR